MADGLYEIDTLAWAEEQADLLRRLAAGERVNDSIDWPNVIEEVHDVGLSQLIGCRSLIRRAMIHLLKIHTWPTSRDVGHWREEVATFLVDAESRYAPSMRQRIDLAVEYEKALRLFRMAEHTFAPARPVPEECPFTLDGLMNGNVDELAADLEIGGGAP